MLETLHPATWRAPLISLRKGCRRFDTLFIPETLDFATFRHRLYSKLSILPVDENESFDSKQRFPPPTQSIRFLRVYSADTSKKTLPEVSRLLYTPNSRFWYFPTPFMLETLHPATWRAPLISLRKSCRRFRSSFIPQTLDFVTFRHRLCSKLYILPLDELRWYL